MKNIVFVTGNAHKAKYFSQFFGTEIAYKNADTPEIQSLDVEEVVIAKAKAAYKILQQPVIVEDTSLVIHGLGSLPGPFIKWFLDELGPEKICRLADTDDTRAATATCSFAYYDGIQLKLFTGSDQGTIAQHPLGKEGFGWNTVFIPQGQTDALGQMSEETFAVYYQKIKRFPALRVFLGSL